MMHTHSPILIAINTPVTHRGLQCVVTACIPDPFGYLIKIEENISMSRLDYLNSLRTHQSMKPLKSWKESKAKLEEAIAKMEAVTNDKLGLNNNAPTKEEYVGPMEIHSIGGNRRPTVTGRTASALPPEVQTFTLADAAREINMNPKVARAKMRRASDVPADAGVKYTWETKHLPRIRTILRGGE